MILMIDPASRLSVKATSVLAASVVSLIAPRAPRG